MDYTKDEDKEKIKESEMRGGVIYLVEEENLAVGKCVDELFSVDARNGDRDKAKERAEHMVKNTFNLYIGTGLTPDELKEKSHKEWAEMPYSYEPVEIDFPIIRVNEIIYE